VNAAEKESILTFCRMAAPATVNLDKMILNNAILKGTLELLPDSPATTTILPLRMKWYIASANATQEAGRARLMAPIELSLPHGTTLRI